MVQNTSDEWWVKSVSSNCSLIMRLVSDLSLRALHILQVSFVILCNCRGDRWIWESLRWSVPSRQKRDAADSSYQAWSGPQLFRVLLRNKERTRSCLPTRKRGNYIFLFDIGTRDLSTLQFIRKFHKFMHIISMQSNGAAVTLSGYASGCPTTSHI